MYLADLHIHSRFSRATSKDCDVPHLAWWARRKGIRLVGTGDFTHPAWRAELREQLVPAGDGVYALREEFRLPDYAPGESPRFLVTGEISSIYKKDGKTRKVHNLILLPSLEAADELSARLEAVGNIHSDGRPILGLDSRDLMELTLDVCPDAEFIPAHIWTPHFSMFGAFSDFSSVEACFGDLAPQIHAVETGLSSDPPMNWRVSALDRMTLVSHSDAHSPSKLGREANLLDAPLSYPGLIHAIRTGEGFLGTVEFFPEEGKYHLDGHRKCGVCLTPAQTAQLGGLCPVCGKKLTVGVEHRVEELADRPEGFRPANAKPFERLAPLPEAIAASTGKSSTCKATQRLYEEMLTQLGSEFFILREAPIPDIAQTAGPCVAEGIRRLRLGQVERKPGFDGEYGVISLLTPQEIQEMDGQTALLGMASLRKKEQAKPPRTISHAPAAQPNHAPEPQTTNPEQQAAILSDAPAMAVVAGPGTGKTHTLTARIVRLVEEQRARPEEITAVTFTNQAAREMRQRLERQLGKKAARMTIGTFHAICLQLLGEVRLISRGEALTLAEEVLRQAGEKGSPQAFLRAVSRVKNGASLEEVGLDPALFQTYAHRLEELDSLDFDDLLTRALPLEVSGRSSFTHLLVDEFQDCSPVQYALVRAWSQGGKSLFVIGDPDQAIYGFRGADSRCFQRLREDFPHLKEIRLKENYRSTPEILQAALTVIARNPGDVRALTPNRPEGLPVRLAQAPDDFAEAVFIAKEIGRMTGGVDMLETQKADHGRETRAFSEIAVLCRTHRQLELVEHCLRHDDIPCVVAGREEFLDDSQVRGVLAFLRSLQVPKDLAALETALRLLWDCPADLVAVAQEICRDRESFPLEELREEGNGYGPLEAWLKRAEEWLPLLEQELPWKLVERWAEAYGSSPSLERLRNVALFHTSLEDLWNALALGQEADLKRAAGKGWESGAVRLMTLHGSKGLEFPAVFLAGVKRGSLPLESRGVESDPQEERRLFFVGMTRAKEELILSWAGEPSPFLSDLPKEVRPERITGRERAAEQLSLF